METCRFQLPLDLPLAHSYMDRPSDSVAQRGVCFGWRHFLSCLWSTAFPPSTFFSPVVVAVVVLGPPQLLATKDYIDPPSAHFLAAFRFCFLHTSDLSPISFLFDTPLVRKESLFEAH